MLRPSHNQSMGNVWYSSLWVGVHQSPPCIMFNTCRCNSQLAQLLTHDIHNFVHGCGKVHGKNQGSKFTPDRKPEGNFFLQYYIAPELLDKTCTHRCCLLCCNAIRTFQCATTLHIYIPTS